MKLITPGDPAGIGPEVACRGLREVGGSAMLVGDRASIAPWRDRCGLQVEIVEPPGDEPIEVRSLRWAVQECQQGRASALITGPINKARLATHGFGWPGHTGFLGHLCGVKDPVMAFVGGRVRVALVTVHVPIAEVAGMLTKELIEHTVRTTALELRLPSPTIAICGLNPHAGDQGLLGREELEIIAPAVQSLRDEGINAIGPISAEAAFLPDTGFDLVVAMYHDQGLVPLKALDFGRTVNWTVGLPIIRTSVDHGTAYNLVGTGRARPDSMVAALRWADTLIDRARCCR